MGNILLFLDYYKVVGFFFFFVIGSVVGSFLNVVIYRLPKKESILYPPSHCPVCGHKLSTKDLIPIVSYIILRGKCRYCGSKISPIYPFVEALTGILFGLLYIKFGLTLFLFKYILFVSVLVVVSFIDLFEGVVYDTIVIPSALVGVVFSIFTKELVNSMLGIAFNFVLFLSIILISKLFYKEGGMGEGDLTASLMIGAFLGLKLSILSFILSFFIGAIAGVIIMLIKKEDGKLAIPFVPYLALGSLVAVFFGNSIISFYLNLF